MPNLYEFITPSDHITFYAEDDDIATAVALYVGNGKAGVEKSGGGDIEGPGSMFFGGISEDAVNLLKKVISERAGAFINACQTFAVCPLKYREEYDEYIKTPGHKEKWHEKHRTSMSDWCKYAWGIKISGVNSE